MTRAVILCGLPGGRSTRLHPYIDAFRAADAELESITIVSYGALTMWRDDDPERMHVALPSRTGRLARRWTRLIARLPGADSAASRERKTGRAMLRGLRRHRRGLALVKHADVIYVDQATAIPSAWWATRINARALVTTSPVEATLHIGARARRQSQPVD